MKKKKGKNTGNSSLGAVVVLILIAFIVFSAAPWLLTVIAVAALIMFAVKLWAGPGEKARKKPRPIPVSALSEAVNNDIRIMNDCVNLLNTSCNLQTVLSRYDLLLDVLQRLSGYEKDPAVSFPHELPSETLVRIKSEKPEIMNRAIQRAYDDTLHKCAALKTEKGRKNRQMKFFDELNGLMPSFPPETRDFTVKFINENIDDPLTGLDGL